MYIGSYHRPPPSSLPTRTTSDTAQKALDPYLISPSHHTLVDDELPATTFQTSHAAVGSPSCANTIGDKNDTSDTGLTAYHQKMKSNNSRTTLCQAHHVVSKQLCIQVVKVHRVMIRIQDDNQPDLLRVSNNIIVVCFRALKTGTLDGCPCPIQQLHRWNRQQLRPIIAQVHHKVSNVTIVLTASTFSNRGIDQILTRQQATRN
jgi:hypothetical protein